MRASLLATTLEALIKLRRPAMVEGPPGLGKTQLFQSVARKMGLALIQIHGPSLKPEDWAVPWPTAADARFGFKINELWPVEGSDHPEFGLILIDEAPQADNDIQKCMANLIQEREIYGHKLKPGWSIGMTGNRQSDRAGANRILSHLRHRVTTLQFDPHLDDWCNWALSNGVKPEVVSFIRFRPELQNNFDPAHEISPTGRGWVEGVSPLIGAVPSEAELECFEGAVGKGPAAEFVTYLRIFRDLPDADLVLSQADTYPVPREMSVLYALTGALGHRADHDNIDRVMAFIRRCPPEFGMMTWQDIANKDATLQTTKPMLDWLRDNAKNMVA